MAYKFSAAEKVGGDGNVTLLPETAAEKVKCRAISEGGGTVDVPLDELLNDYADEINENTEAVKVNSEDIKKFSTTPNILFDSNALNNFDELMRGFLNPLSTGYCEPVFYDGPEHGRGEEAFSRGVLLPTEKILFLPNSSNAVSPRKFAIYDYINDTISDGVDFTSIGSLGGGMLLPNTTKILFNNGESMVFYDFVKETFTMGAYHGKSFGSGWALIPGTTKIILPPFSSPNVGIYDYGTDTYTDGAAHGKGENAFINGVLMLNDKILFSPDKSDKIGIYDYKTDTYTDGPKPNVTISGIDASMYNNNKFSKGILLPDGKVILTPYKYFMGIYDPSTDKVQTTRVNGSGTITSGYHASGGVRLPNGDIIFPPFGTEREPYIVTYDYKTGTVKRKIKHGHTEWAAFASGVLTPNGKVIFPPRNSPRVGIYDLMGTTIGMGYCLHPFIR